MNENEVTEGMFELEMTYILALPVKYHEALEQVAAVTKMTPEAIVRDIVGQTIEQNVFIFLDGFLKAKQQARN